MTPQQFLDVLLVYFSHVIFVVGKNVRFGHHGFGNQEFLKSRISNRLDVKVISELYVDGFSISSSRIRMLLMNGSVEKVALLLGRYFFLEGEVCEGNKVGRTIGFPTINVQNFPQMQPKTGVYQTNIRVEGSLQKYPAMSFVGSKSKGLINGKVNDSLTLHHGRHVEIHVCCCFHENVSSGQKIKIEFIRFMREKMTFNSSYGLQKQLRRDKENVLKYFRENDWS